MSEVTISSGNFFPFKCHAVSQDRLYKPGAANRIAYKFRKALFPRTWTRWCTALNVKNDFPGYSVLMNTAGRLSDGHYIIMLLLS
jgi:hypothetical protein